MMNATTKKTLASPWIYFVATFAWSWLILGAAIGLHANMETATGLAFLVVAAAGPMVTGIGFTYLTRDSEGRRDYWQRLLSFRRIPARWYMVIFLFAPILYALAVLLDVLTGGSGAIWGEAALGFASNPLSVIPSLLFASLFPFIEELGWRGYVLDRLQERRNALVSSLILGVVWSLWHLPSFFLEGTYQASLGIGTPAFWLFMVGIVPLSLPFTWIYNNTGRSTLAVILFHSMINFTGELIALSGRADTISTLLWFVAAIAITVLWGAGTMTQSPWGARTSIHTQITRKSV